jgi:triacylglycerol lipase
MTRTFFSIFLFFLIHPCFAKLEPGFDKTEARDMIMICNSFTYLDIYQDDEKILPEGYEKRYTSGTFGMDNKYQVYVKDNIAVINFRGSTDKQLSWIENFHASMIPAKGVIRAEGRKFDYCFAKDTGAAVHSGYALGLAFLEQELMFQIKMLNHEGIYNIILTGHSQGGALANMFRAYLENLPSSILPEKNIFKTYTFAAPMVGNKKFAQEYNRRFASDGTSFNIVNTADVIPTFPVNYNDSNYLRDNVNALVYGKDFSIKKMLLDGGARIFDVRLSQLMGYVGNSVNKKVSKEVSAVEMPARVKDINYFPLGSRIELNEFEYPKILKDSSILENDSLMHIYPRDADGNFYNRKLYESGSWTWQHKPHNYYVAILKKYFPQDYESLEQKYLPENL